MTFYRVTREEFFARVAPMNVHPCPEGEYPYLVLWRMLPTREVIGRSRDGMYELKDKDKP